MATVVVVAPESGLSDVDVVVASETAVVGVDVVEGDVRGAEVAAGSTVSGSLQPGREIASTSRHIAVAGSGAGAVVAMRRMHTSGRVLITDDSGREHRRDGARNRQSIVVIISATRKRGGHSIWRTKAVFDADCLRVSSIRGSPNWQGSPWR